MADTKIEWADKTWNPVTGCTKVSEGCRNCYAERMARRLAANPKLKPEVAQRYEFFKVALHPDRLNQPLRWRKPRVIFPCSMGDLFHEDVPDEYLLRVFDMMRRCTHEGGGVDPDHTFMVLTKRPERMRDFCTRLRFDAAEAHDSHGSHLYLGHDHDRESSQVMSRLKHVWLGVSAEDQATADERIPILLDTPAAKRFVSIEPMLGAVDIGMSSATCDCCERWPSRWVRLRRRVTSELPMTDASAAVGVYRAHSNQHGALSVQPADGSLLGIKPAEFECLPGLDLVILGGETGPGARPMHPDWARSVRDQCVEAGVPFFLKQLGPTKAAGRLLDGRTWDGEAS